MNGDPFALYIDRGIAMTEPKLKPCPFCGGEAEYDEDFFGRAYIQCSNCEAHLQDKKAYQDCIEAWNTRVVAE